VPPLKENAPGAKPLSMRELLAQHRENPACASCHRVMDPLGFALENFDGVGRWRAKEPAGLVDASGELADGTTLDGPASLRAVLLSRPEQFVRTMTEKMLIYALGRGFEHTDMPVVRAVVRDARRNDYRFSGIVMGIVKSTPFQMRRAGRTEELGN
jgi:hypothetical protein